MEIESLSTKQSNKEQNRQLLYNNKKQDDGHQFVEELVWNLKSLGMSDYQAYKMIGSGFKVSLVSRLSISFIYMIIAILAILFLLVSFTINKVEDYIAIAPVLNAKVTENWQYNEEEIISGLDSSYDSEYYLVTSQDFTGEDFNAKLQSQVSQDSDIVSTFKVGEDIKPGIYTVDISNLDHFDLQVGKAGYISNYSNNGGSFVNLPLYEGDVFEAGCKYNPYSSADTCQLNLYAQEDFIEYSTEKQVPGIYIYGLSNLDDTTTINTRDYSLNLLGKDGRYHEYNGLRLNDVNDGKFYFDDRYNTDTFDTEFTFNNEPGSYIIINDAANSNSLNVTN